MDEIIRQLIEHGAEFAIIDPAFKGRGLRGATTVAKDWIGPERVEAIREVFRRAGGKIKAQGD